MLKLYFNDSPEVKYLVEFKMIANNRIEIIGDIPKNTSGFVLSRADHVDHWDYSDFTTIYNMLANNIIQFSNDGSHWMPPRKNVVVKAIWEDNEDVGGKRPKTVKVTTYLNGKLKNMLTLRKSNAWTKEYADVLDEDVYTIDADDVDGYTKDVNGTSVIYRLEVANE